MTTKTVECYTSLLADGYYDKHTQISWGRMGLNMAKIGALTTIGVSSLYITLSTPQSMQFCLTAELVLTLTLMKGSIMQGRICLLLFA